MQGERAARRKSPVVGLEEQPPDDQALVLEQGCDVPSQDALGSTSVRARTPFRLGSDPAIVLSRVRWGPNRKGRA
jgi:hypothetical protein